jgi:L-lactate dehydrogenase complex protein LldG
MANDLEGAKMEILRHIAAASAETATDGEKRVREDWGRLPRSYRHAGRLSQSENLDLLKHRLRDYGATVEECLSREVVSVLGGMLRRRNAHRIVLPAGFPQSWLPAGPEFLDGEHMDATALDLCDGVLTTATVAIAETGTLVLQRSPGQGRRSVTLVPDYHLCIVEASNVVQLVPEAFLRIKKTMTLPTTFISGPSATADIEMTRIKGVHGPRVLDVLVIR